MNPIMFLVRLDPVGIANLDKEALQKWTQQSKASNPLPLPKGSTFMDLKEPTNLFVVLTASSANPATHNILVLRFMLFLHLARFNPRSPRVLE